MSRRSFRRSIVLTSCLAVTLSACSAVQDSSEKPGKHLNFVTVFAANSTDPHICRTSFILDSGAVERLVGIDRKAQTLTPELATKWESRDGRTWHFTIRDGVKFHNGKPVTAEAVKASLADAVAKNPGMKTALQIKDMKATGQQLTVVTDGVRASLPSELVHYNAVITDVSDDKGLPVGTGPFSFTSFDPNGAAELARFEGYWGGRAKLDTVTMTANEDANARMLALRSGAADVIHQPSTESLDAIRNDPALTVEAVPGTRVYHLMYDFQGPHRDLWNNVEFRRGIDALVDREQIAKTVLHGAAEVVDNPFSQGRPVAPAVSPRPFGKEVALQHFAKAGLTVDGGKVTQNGKPLSLDLATYVARPELPQIAQVFQAAAADAGIAVTIHNADNIDEYLTTNRTWDLATYSVSTFTRADGSYFVNGAFLPDGAQNPGGLSDPWLISTITRFNETMDPSQRTQLMQKVGEHVRDQALNSYIVEPKATAAYNKKVTGWVTPSNEFEFPMMTTALDVR